MPLVLALLVTTLGLSLGDGLAVLDVRGRRGLLSTGIAYYLLTQDTPRGFSRELSATDGARPKARGTFALACRDQSAWMLFVAYGLCLAWN